MAVLGFPMLALAYPELRTSHEVAIVSAIAVRYDTDHPVESLIIVTAKLLFSNPCMIPDVLFKNRTHASGHLQIWVRGASRRDMLCPMLYQPSEINVVVDSEIWNRDELPLIKVNGKEINIQYDINLSSHMNTPLNPNIND